MAEGDDAGTERSGILYRAARMLESATASDIEYEDAAKMIDMEQMEGNWVRVGMILSQMNPVAVQRLISALDRIIAVENRLASTTECSYEGYQPGAREVHRQSGDDSG